MSLLRILSCFARVLRSGAHLGRPLADGLNISCWKSFLCRYCDDPHEFRKTYLITPCVEATNRRNGFTYCVGIKRTSCPVFVTVCFEARSTRKLVDIRTRDKGFVAGPRQDDAALQKHPSSKPSSRAMNSGAVRCGTSLIVHARALCAVSDYCR